MADVLLPPIRYATSIERPEPDEAETIADLNRSFDTILETTSQDYSKAVRAVHAKAHGILRAELTVHPGLPRELAQGLFATPATHPVWMRFSTNPGDILDDSIGLPRGLAWKVLDVEGDRLPGAHGRTQDFVMVNGPAFAAPTPKKFAGNLKLLSKTTDKAEWAKKALSFVLRGAEAALEAVGTESALLKNMGGAKNVHPLGETYFSAVPFRHGEYVAKYQVVPVSADLTALTDIVIDASGRPNAIREDMQASMKGVEGVWEVRVQLLRNAEAQPIEDASVEWPEDVSPFQTVATLRATSQDSWAAEKVAEVDENLRFSVWTGLTAHQPLGGVNRVRRPVYEHSADYRRRFNGCPLHEPG
ncbi:catalase family protein [Sphingomonas sp. CFBP 13720]|uniref:catalase family protein n=1 Tax=Sphingomonas sp. CFBP 13720 TaxID=2775302 RepID=UPI001784B135|nr:catalase family protein [Sphingomonas sp. CFBP 13720]MBD8679629.1 catalase family protein [Sphingomonas sp. CFBP 13720]